MSAPPPVDPAALREALLYLREMGYGELYLPAAGGPAGRGAPRPPEPARAAAPERTDPPPPAGGGSGSGSDPGSDPAPDPAPDEAPDDAATRAARLAELASEAATCERCRLWRDRRSVVFGTGDPDADLMFVGEGPGAEEDRQGLPFVGPAGALLTRIIEAIELTRDRVYITNVVKCRPPNNRDPLPDEAGACRGYLERQIDLIRPKVIVALGRVAAQALLGNDLPLGRMRGRWSSVRGVPTMVTYHPAALLRNQAWKRPTWEDMQAVRDRLRELA
ncbi:MAG: uracil-DNA glycosylase [Acidobacteriota bacterium]|jgi:DNA polymerase